MISAQKELSRGQPAINLAICSVASKDIPISA
ncbi:hypothetical protein RCCS2_11252 [Roseobacter sp. CCS2]|nr:hypothetical protein RCCS2_11252 [Roseobacter sp. CCS2]